MQVIEIKYAYPSSDIGGKHGCYYTDHSKTGEQVKYNSETVAVRNAVDSGCKVILCYGPPERADKYRCDGVIHGLGCIAR